MTSPQQVRVPMAAPERMTHDERDAVMAAVREVLATGPYIGGPAVDRFEDALASYVGTSYAVGVDNGSNALTIALQALDLPPSSVVLVPPNDGGFAAAAAQAAGHRPMVVDVDPASGLLSAETVAAGHVDGTAAVVVTHLHGMVAEVDGVVAWAADHGIAVVEDCAQAHGARRGGRHAGAFGDVATFSFYPTKNLGAVGDGGALVTGRPDVAERARSLRQYGWSPRFRVADAQGRNSRLDPLQAAVLTARLPYLESANDRRRAVLRRYREALPAATFLAASETEDVVHHAVVRTGDRDGLRDHLTAQGVATDVHYPYLVQEMPGIALAGTRDTPAADALRRECLSLPCFPGMTDDELDSVCGALAGWCGDA